VADDGREVTPPDDDVAVLGLDAATLREASWRWLLDALASGRWAGRVLAVAVRPDTLFDRLACALARSGVTLARSDTPGRWRAARGEVGADVAVPEALRALLREGRSLRDFAARLGASLAGRIEAVAGYVAAARAARPGASLVVEGDRLVASTGRSLDLTAAPFEDDPGDALERDLRALLEESPPWSAPDRVCPCGAARAMVPRLLSPQALASLQDEGHTPMVRARFEVDGALRAAMVVSLECDRHRRPVTRADLDRWGWRDEELAARVDRDAADATFFARVAAWRDRAGRGVMLAQGPDLATVVLRDDWVHALAGLTEAPLTPAFACATSPHGVVAWEADADPELVRQAMQVDALLDPVGRREVTPLTDARAVSPSAPRGRFVRLAAPGDTAPS
jgi:hypothetical protein